MNSFATIVLAKLLADALDYKTSVAELILEVNDLIYILKLLKIRNSFFLQKHLHLLIVLIRNLLVRLHTSIITFSFFLKKSIISWKEF